ncbi:hypothetical protein K6119_04765 [Paracrocinitomix mangrovi]|uniref:hypothetical protein n=1 Tax=Paracrocinitomix mangrovi TaxID=2862509 RepID=UPI001C8E2BC2|nr:hypothetical protein [Paracrocinitomix mangrovi]UKN02827.1 hypothetical protein K6119_04765 [Paracrocinitomix mangrovi]
MKHKKFLFIALISLSAGLYGCKAIARTAAKYWTKKQIKEFVENCEERSSKLIGEEKAEKYCNCAVDKVAEKYPKFEDYKKIGIVEALKIAKDCK